MDSTVGINEQGLLSTWNMSGFIGQHTATLSLEADRVGLHGQVVIPSLSINKNINSPPVDRRQAAALAGIGALPRNFSQAILLPSSVCSHSFNNRTLSLYLYNYVSPPKKRFRISLTDHYSK